MKVKVQLIDEEAAESLKRWYGGKFQGNKVWNIWCVCVSGLAVFIAGSITAILTLFTESGTKAFGYMLEGAEFSMKGEDGNES